MIYLRKLLVVPVLLAMCLISSCKDDPTSEVRPVLTLDMDPASSEIVIPRAGGIFSVKYTLENPVEGASIDVDYAADWVEFDLSAPNAILFDAAENPGEQARSVEVTVTYPGMKESPRFVITQDGTSSHLQDVDFEITVRDINFMSATLDVVPSDPQMYYVIFYVDAEYADQYPDDESLFQADMDFFSMVAEAYMESISETIWYYVYQGDCLDYPIMSLYPSSEYVAYVYGINPDTTERLTAIERVRFHTPEVEMADVSFDFDIAVNGPNAEITVKPTNNYDGYYSIDVYKRELFDDMSQLDEQLFDSWMNMISWYISYGYLPEELLPSLCVKGEQTLDKSLSADCDYVVVAYAINDDALICSPAVYREFRTGGVAKSDNEITLTVKNVGSRKAQIAVNTTNEDPYALIITGTQLIEGFTSDDEIAAYLMEYSLITPQSGDLEETISNLQPECGYSLIAFGYYGKVKTTEGIFRVDFTTAAAKDSDITAEAVWNHHYDSQAVAALDGQWAGYADAGQCLMPFTINTVPAETGSVFYKLYTVAALQNPAYTDENIAGELIYYGPKERFSIAVVPYDTDVIIAAIAQDENGDYGKLWKSEVFSLAKNDVSDPQEFLDNLPTRQSSTSCVTSRSDEPVLSPFAATPKRSPATQEGLLSGKRLPLGKKTDGPARPLRIGGLH